MPEIICGKKTSEEELNNFCFIEYLAKNVKRRSASALVVLFALDEISRVKCEVQAI